MLPVLVIAAVLLTLALLPGSTPRIRRRLHPNGLAVLERIPVSETRQWVVIRSEDVANPVVLFLHGGPGTAMLTLLRKNTRPLEKHFTVVNWDQRGAGKSFGAGRDPDRMTMGQFVEDVIDLSSYLVRRFHKQKILLVGHSWGSAIGMLAVAQRPDLFSAYVGIGQFSDAAEGERLSYEWTLEQARRAMDRASVKKLTEIGPPPYTGASWRAKFMTERQILGKHGGELHGSGIGAFGVVLRNVAFSREYTLLDRINVFRGIFRSVQLLFPELYRLDLFAAVPAVQVPVYFCLGRHDYEVPSILSARYYEALRAPRKQLLWFENSAHLPNTEEKEKFNRFLIESVRPTLSD